MRHISASGSLHAGQGSRAGCLEWAPHVAGVHVQDADVGRRAHGRGRRRGRGRLRGRRGRRRVERRRRRAVRAGRLRRGRHERRRLRHLRSHAFSIIPAASPRAHGAQHDSASHSFRQAHRSISTWRIAVGCPTWWAPRASRTCDESLCGRCTRARRLRVDGRQGGLRRGARRHIGRRRSSLRPPARRLLGAPGILRHRRATAWCAPLCSSALFKALRALLAQAADAPNQALLARCRAWSTCGPARPPAHRSHHRMEPRVSCAAGRGGPTETRSAGLPREQGALPRGSGVRAPEPGHTPRRRTRPATSAAAAAAAAHTLRRQSRRPRRRRLRPGARTAPARPPAHAGPWSGTLRLPRAGQAGAMLGRQKGKGVHHPRRVPRVCSRVHRHAERASRVCTTAAGAPTTTCSRKCFPLRKHPILGRWQRPPAAAAAEAAAAAAAALPRRHTRRQTRRCSRRHRWARSCRPARRARRSRPRARAHTRSACRTHTRRAARAGCTPALARAAGARPRPRRTARRARRRRTRRPCCTGSARSSSPRRGRPLRACATSRLGVRGGSGRGATRPPWRSANCNSRR